MYVVFMGHKNDCLLYVCIYPSTPVSSGSSKMDIWMLGQMLHSNKIKGSFKSLLITMFSFAKKSVYNSDEVITIVCVYEDSKYCQMALIGFYT